MLHVTAILCDCVLIATRINGPWIGKVTDVVTGISTTFTWTDEQIGAVMALALAGETFQTSSMGQLHDLAEDAVRGIPPECQLIP